MGLQDGRLKPELFLSPPHPPDLGAARLSQGGGVLGVGGFPGDPPRCGCCEKIPRGGRGGGGISWPWGAPTLPHAIGDGDTRLSPRYGEAPNPPQKPSLPPWGLQSPTLGQGSPELLLPPHPKTNPGRAPPRAHPAGARKGDRRRRTQTLMSVLLQIILFSLSTRIDSVTDLEQGLSKWLRSAQTARGAARPVPAPAAPPWKK